MGPHTHDDDIHPAARALIPDKVRGIVGRFGFNRSDTEDLAQELALNAHLASRRFDPSRTGGFRYFDRVLSNKVRSIVEHATRQKRDRWREQSLNGGDPAVHGVHPADQIDLAIDVRNALATLTPADREVAWLLATDSVAGVARHTDSTRGTIRGAKARIARALAAKNLAPTSTGEQPIPAGNRYVFNVGTFQLLNSRSTGRTTEVVGVLPPSRGQREALPAEEGAPSWPHLP